MKRLIRAAIWSLPLTLSLTLLSTGPWTSAASSPPSGRLTIFFTGYVRGNFGPCGCKADPSGGLSRRSGYSRSYADRTGDAIVQVDLGTYFLAPGPHAKTVNELMTDGLSRLPVRVMNLTPNDLYYWPELAGLDSPTRIISSNLRPRGRDLPAPARSAVVTVPAADLGIDRDLRIGFLGVSDPRLVKPNSGFVGADPLQSIAEARRELEGRVDFFVVMADVDLGPGEFSNDSLPAKIAEPHDDVYAVLVSERRYLLRTPLQVNNAVLLSSVERGRHLGRLTFSLDAGGRVTEADTEFTQLNEGVPEDSYFQNREASLPPEAIP